MYKKIILFVLASFIFSGCTTQGSKVVTGGTLTTNFTENTIQIKNFAFDPTEVTARPGSVISITNNDTVPHTVTADDKSFDSGTINPGETRTMSVPRTTGSFTFYCTYHAYMRGTLTITGTPMPTPTD